MTVQQFASLAIRNTMRGEQISTERAYRDPRIAAWLVWSMRKTPLCKEDHKTFNRARRALQRAGFVRV